MATSGLSEVMVEKDCGKMFGYNLKVPGSSQSINDQSSDATTMTPSIGLGSDISGPDTPSRQFMAQTFQMIDDYMFGHGDSAKPVVKLATPDEINRAVNLNIGAQGRSHAELRNSCERILEYSVNTSSPHFHNQLFASCRPEAICGEFLTAVSNVSMYTYEVAPVYSAMEAAIFEKMQSFLGWETADGIFCPGGSMSNFYGMNLARFRACQRVEIDIKAKGMRAAPHLVAFVSSHGHYSIKKAAAFLGIGTDNVIEVDADERGSMVVKDLSTKIEAAIAEGQTPFLVQATAATTVLGGYDDLNAICDVCEKHGIWVHVDGAWGASVILSPEHRHLMAGVERCDSIAWNPHKMMGIPLQCSAFLVRHPDILKPAHAYGAKYLFQKDKLNANLDTGDKSVQCGRKVDVLKLWMAWALAGDEGYRQHVNNFMAVASYLKEQVVTRENFLLVTDTMCSNVCFWFVPPSVRSVKPHSEEWKSVVHKAAATIKQRMQEKGSLMVGFQSIGLHNDANPANFFRMVVMSDQSTNAHMDYLLNEIERLGADL
jgi:sulfinoalanine decarboxylase